MIKIGFLYVHYYIIANIIQYTIQYTIQCIILCSAQCALYITLYSALYSAWLQNLRINKSFTWGGNSVRLKPFSSESIGLAGSGL